MSTIKVNNLQNASGSSNSTPEEIQQGRAKAWVNFDGTGTPSISEDYNVSSITDEGTGQYTITFDSSQPNANYVVAGTGTWSSLSWGLHITVDGATIATSGFKIHTVYTNSSNFNNTDCKIAMVTIFGD